MSEPHADASSCMAGWLRLTQAAVQSTSSWRKVQVRLEGEPAYESMDPLRRLEVFQEHTKCASATGLPARCNSSPRPTCTAHCQWVCVSCCLPHTLCRA